MPKGLLAWSARSRPVALVIALAAVLVAVAASALTVSLAGRPGTWRDGGGALAEASFWSAAAPAAAHPQRDGRPVELGMRFAVAVPGTVTALRFYRIAGDPGPHTASLWDSAGRLRARVTVPPGTSGPGNGPGWRQAKLGEPLRLNPGTEYTVSYHSKAGAYAATEGFFTGRPQRSGPLYAPGERNGVFRYGETGFPTETYLDSNYFVDLVFRYRPAPEATPPAGPRAGPSGGPSGDPSAGDPSAGTSAGTAGLPPVTGDVGPGYYARWRSGPPSDAAYFPIGVWLQDPRRQRGGRTNAVNYRELGVNTFIGLHGWPPDTGQLDALAAAGLTVLGGVDRDKPAGLRRVLGHRQAGILRGHVLYDEPDMNQFDGTPAGSGCVPPAVLQRHAANLRKADPDRPVYVNFGKGMASPAYLAPKCDNSPAALAAYAKACDICSVDFYPIADKYEPAERKGIYTVGLAVDRLRWATGGRKPVWGFVETTRIQAGGGKATPAQVRSLAWMQLIHGARGLEYFAHEFRESGVVEDALLADTAMVTAVTALNREIRTLAPVLNAPTVTGGLTTSTSASTSTSTATATAGTARRPAAGVDTLVRRHGGATYVFAIGGGSAAVPRGAPTTASFRLHGPAAGTGSGSGTGTVEVIGEGRTLPMTGGAFTDRFGPYQVHLYKITG